MLAQTQLLKTYITLNPNELTKQQILNLEHEIQHPRSKVSSDEYVDFKLWCMHLPSRQETFANYLLNKLPKFNGAKILEVGCGQTARLSHLLATKGFNMTCIDPKVEPRDNIECIKAKFNYNTFDLTPYDYIIAQEPCDATEHIIRACIAQQKPFLISLCGTPHKLISGYMPKDVYEWYNQLQKIACSKTKLIYASLDPLTVTPILRSIN